jgi:methyl-accepting chemotaxis protein
MRDVRTQAQGAQRSALAFMAGVALVSVAVGSLLALALTRSITGPLRRAVRAARGIAEGDLTFHLEVDRRDEVGQLLAAFEAMTGRLRAALQAIGGAAGRVASAADQLSAITAESRRAIQQEELRIDQVATAVNQMSATVHEVARNAQGAAEAATDSDRSAADGKAVVGAAVQAIHALAAGVEQASGVIQALHGDTEDVAAILDTIRGIAEQTNLLALNAAIEAARAGEQGRGFAVVADEVRALASRSRDATGQIQQVIAKLQAAAEGAVAVMQDGRGQAARSVEQASAAGTALEAIAARVAAIRDMNAQIASAAEEQTAVAADIDRNVTEISQIAQQTTAAAERTAGAAEDLARLADELRSETGRFKLSAPGQA